MGFIENDPICVIGIILTNNFRFFKIIITHMGGIKNLCHHL